MNFKTTYILFGVFAAVLVVFGVTQLLGLQSPKDKSVYALPSLHDKKKPVRSEDIGTVEIVRTQPVKENLVFYRTDQGWKLREPSVRVDGYAVDRLVQEVIDAKKEDKADVTENLKQFGLEKPKAVVTLTQKGGDRKWELNLGDESVTGGSTDKMIYVTSSDHLKQPLAVRRSDLDNLFKKVNDFRSKSLLAESSFDIVSAKLQEPKHELIDLEKKADGKWRFEKPAFGEADFEGETTAAAGKEQKITGVRDLLQAIVDVRVESDSDFGATNASDADLAGKGLEKGKEQLRIEVKRQPSSIGTAEKKPAIQEALLIGKKADDKGEKFYARLENEKNIVKVPAKKVEAILHVIDSPSVLRNRDLAQVDTAKVDAIDLRPNDRELVKLRKSGQPADWKLFESGKSHEADNSAVQGLLTALTAKRQVKDFPDASKSDASLGLDKPSAVVLIWVEGIKKDEKAKDEKKDENKAATAKDEKKDQKKAGTAKDAKDKAKDEKAAKKEEKKDANAEPALKDAKPSVKLVFGKKDKDLVYVRREVGSDTIRLAVPATLLDKLTEGKLAYLSHKLPNFGFNSQVSKILLARNGQTYELDKSGGEKTAEVWKLKQPKDMAGRTADSSKVEQLLSGLRDLQAVKLVTEKPSASELERYGLKSPAISATITIAKPDKKTEDFVYLFGKETEDKADVYAKQGSRDMVFLVAMSVLEPLQSDFRDSTVFHIEVPKVKGLKLIGWQDVVGNPFILDLERKSAQDWVVKNPAGFKLNVPLAESLLTWLSQVKFVRHLGKGVPKPEQKLAPQEGALELVLTLEGEKDPYTLTIGGPSDHEGYFSRSNKLPDEIFIVPKGNFEQIKKMPAYFKLP